MSNIIKVDNKDTRTMPGASIVNYEHISHFILLLLLLNANKQMIVGPEKLMFPTKNFFLVIKGSVLPYELGKAVRLHVFIFIPLT